MLKTLLLIIIGLLFGYGVAVLIQIYKPPPGRRPPRPNIMRRDKLKKVAWPLGIAIGVAAVVWAGLSFFQSPPRAAGPQITNTVNLSSQEAKVDGRPPVEDKTLTGQAGQPKLKPPGRILPTDGRPLMTISSPLARGTLETAPVMATLDSFGVGHRLGQTGTPTVSKNLETKPVEPSHEGSAKHVVKTTARSEPRVAPKTSLKPAIQPIDKPEGSSMAPPEVKPADSLPGGRLNQEFTVHLASFEEKDNAERVLTKLKAAGVPAFLSMIDVRNKPYHRLMAGRFATRSEAEAFGRQLVARGLTTDKEGFSVKTIIGHQTGD